MEYKETIKDQALRVNDLLSIYIKLHDKVFKKQATFLSLFKRKDFDGIYNQTENMASLFSSKKEELNSLKVKFSGNIPPQYKQYFLQLLLFFEKLCHTVELLKERQYLLYLISKGEKYRYKDYMEIESKYQKSVETYMEEGQKLNSLNHIILN